MPLFPEMPVPGAAAPPPLNGVNGRAAQGTLPGLNASLLAVFGNYMPGEIGVSELSEKVNINLPIAEWAWFPTYVEVDQPTISAGSASDQTFYTIPSDRRCYLDGMNVLRSGGDNLVDRLYITYPEGYYTNTGGVRVIPLLLGSGATTIWWPDNSGVQTAGDYFMPSSGPLFLEPGTTLGFRTTGAGASGSGFKCRLMVRFSPLVRSMVPAGTPS